jgi:hypothetical protein
MTLPGLVAANNLLDVENIERVWDNLGNGVDTGEAEALNYISRVEQVDGQPLEAEVKTAITLFILGCKADGIWNAIKASCILAGARTLNGALVPLTGPQPSIVGPFVSGDYDRKTGLKGNGTTKGLNTNRNNNTDPQDSKHMSIYATTAPSGSGFPRYIGTVGGTGLSVIGVNRVSTDIFMNINSSVGIGTGAGTATATGFIGASRNTSTSVITRLLGVSVANTNTSQSRLSSNIHIFSNGGTGNFSDARVSFYSIGESLDLALLDARITTLMNALSVAIL